MSTLISNMVVYAASALGRADFGTSQHDEVFPFQLCCYAVRRWSSHRGSTEWVLVKETTLLNNGSALTSCIPFHSPSLSPALEDRRVTADDLKLAVKLAIAPRGIFMQTPPDDEEMMVSSLLLALSPDIVR